jgi:hypothetical protein
MRPLPIPIRDFGATEFATANVKDFDGFGFDKLWIPLPTT